MTKKDKAYFEGVGRRKSSTARVRIWEDETEAGISINRKELSVFFTREGDREVVLAPLKATGTEKKLKISAFVKGGGITGQADAIRLGLVRALVKLNSEFHRTLGDLGYLKRDPRKKERKKPGLKKARRAPQWQKR